MSKKRKIRFAYDAWWFLYEHPAFKIGIIDRKTGVKSHHIFRHAMTDLDIYYAAVDTKGIMNDDHSKRVRTEVWLELGPIEWMRECTHGWGLDNKELQALYADDYTSICNSHDYRLDCGAPTFDEALVKLAKKVLKYYGDYEEDECDGQCEERAQNRKIIDRIMKRSKVVKENDN